MRTVAIIQARYGSTRLPGKILADLGGMPILAWVVRAARAAELVDRIVVATTTSDTDDATVQLCETLGVDVIRGPEDDVLSRFLIAMQKHPTDLVVRLTADCPFLDPQLIDAAVALAASPARPDYTSTTLVRTLPRGLDVEVVRSQALMRAERLAHGYDRAHVTSYLYTHPEAYRCLGVCTPLDASAYRVTVDTVEDFHAATAIVDRIGSQIADATRVVALLRSDEAIVRINAHIEQKPLQDG